MVYDRDGKLTLLSEVEAWERAEAVQAERRALWSRNPDPKPRRRRWFLLFRH